MRRFSKTEEVSSAVRYVPEQPLEFTRFNNGVKQYNLRKLNQMPYHLAHSKRYNQLNSEVNQQYTNTKENSRVTIKLWNFGEKEACSPEITSFFILGKASQMR